MNTMEEGFRSTSTVVKMIITRTNQASKRGAKTMIMMIAWEIWNARNASVFR